jgi:hypothetical protein
MPDVFYCPSSRQEKWFRVVFEKKYFQSDKVPWPMYAVDGQVNMTYNYFPQSAVAAKKQSLVGSVPRNIWREDYRCQRRRFLAAPQACL